MQRPSRPFIIYDIDPSAALASAIHWERQASARSYRPARIRHVRDLRALYLKLLRRGLAASIRLLFTRKETGHAAFGTRSA